MLGVAADATVTGTWTMNVEGGRTARHDGARAEAGGTKVTGTFSSGHSADMDVAGEFKDGELNVETTAGDSKDHLQREAEGRRHARRLHLEPEWAT
jgi:hypothetical protein